MTDPVGLRARGLVEVPSSHQDACSRGDDGVRDDAMAVGGEVVDDLLEVRRFNREVIGANPMHAEDGPSSFPGGLFDELDHLAATSPADIPRPRVGEVDAAGIVGAFASAPANPEAVGNERDVGLASGPVPHVGLVTGIAEAPYALLLGEVGVHDVGCSIDRVCKVVEVEFLQAPVMAEAEVAAAGMIAGVVAHFVTARRCRLPFLQPTGIALVLTRAEVERGTQPGVVEHGDARGQLRWRSVVEAERDGSLNSGWPEVGHIAPQGVVHRIRRRRPEKISHFKMRFELLVRRG